MILVLNLNASIDKRYTLKDLVKGAVQRADAVDNTPGGKGLHVANVDTILGEDTLVTGWLGGKSGEFIAERVHDYGIRGDFVPVAGETRSCLAIITEDGAQTEILEPGPTISPDELAAFREKFRALLAKADVVVASGSMPRGVPDTFYAELIRETHAAAKPFLLDTSGKRLEEGIKAKPDFIKPNKDEIEALRGRPVKDEAAVVREVQAFLDDGIPLAVVSLGAAGSIAGCQEGLFRITVPHIDCVNPVGSGDSFVAGAAAGFARHLPVPELLRLAAACGTANAMEAESGFVRKETVESLLPQITVTQL